MIIRKDGGTLSVKKDLDGVVFSVERKRLGIKSTNSILLSNEEINGIFSYLQDGSLQGEEDGEPQPRFFT